jgi:hypothetical protein
MVRKQNVSVMIVILNFKVFKTEKLWQDNYKELYKNIVIVC